MMVMKDNYSFFLSANLEKYLGQWVAIVDRKVVSSGVNAKKVLVAARRKFPSKTPLLAKVPTKEAMIL